MKAGNGGQGSKEIMDGNSGAKTFVRLSRIVCRTKMNTKEWNNYNEVE